MTRRRPILAPVPPALQEKFNKVGRLFAEHLGAHRDLLERLDAGRRHKSPDVQAAWDVLGTSDLTLPEAELIARVFEKDPRERRGRKRGSVNGKVWEEAMKRISEGQARAAVVKDLAPEITGTNGSTSAKRAELRRLIRRLTGADTSNK